MPRPVRLASNADDSLNDPARTAVATESEVGVLTRMRCVVPLFDQRSSRRIVAVEDRRSVGTAQALDWPGVLLEAGRNDVAEVDDLTLAHHYVGANTDRVPITMEVKEEGRFRAVVLPPGTRWLAPAGDVFSLRLNASIPHAYVRISIDPLRFDRLVSMPEDTARSPALRRTYTIDGPQVQHLVSALAEEARSGTPSGIAFVETLTTALGLQLVKLAGEHPRRREIARGGLAPTVRRRVLELMEAQS